MKKIAVIGAGNVGAHVVSSCIHRNLLAEFLLLDLDEKMEKAQILDLKDTLLFSPNSKVFGVDQNSKELSSADIFVITAGAAQNPGETRCQLLGRNVKILQNIRKSIGEIKKSAIVILVTNPVDILTQLASETFDLPQGHIFGMGTLLDSARLRWRLAQEFNANISGVSGFVLGEHGDSEFVAWSTVKGSEKISEKRKSELEYQTMRAAYKIIDGKGSTYFGIGAATAEILENILNDSHCIFPLSVPLKGEYGLERVSVGVPARISSAGILEVIELDLSLKEKEKLQISAEKLKSLFINCPREG